ncbi:hypothetical protein AURDEDRAFT_173565 [Auricularia subglabra TFB-10046 SS5]|nr:hypothetical protein AURDEDRAFT_173565 [Auricularia subglabra TFB-10046 SS5]
MSRSATHLWNQLPAGARKAFIAKWEADSRWTGDGERKSFAKEVCDDFKTTFPGVSDPGKGSWEKYWDTKIKNARKNKFKPEEVTKGAINKVFKPPTEQRSKKKLSARYAFARAHADDIQTLYDVAITSGQEDAKPGPAVRSQRWNEAVNTYIASHEDEFEAFRTSYVPGTQDDLEGEEQPETGDDTGENDGGGGEQSSDGKDSTSTAARPETSIEDRIRMQRAFKSGLRTTVDQWAQLTGYAIVVSFAGQHHDGEHNIVASVHDDQHKFWLEHQELRDELETKLVRHSEAVYNGEPLGKDKREQRLFIPDSTPPPTPPHHAIESEVELSQEETASLNSEVEQLELEYRQSSQGNATPIELDKESEVRVEEDTPSGNQEAMDGVEMGQGNERQDDLETGKPEMRQSDDSEGPEAIDGPGNGAENVQQENHRSEAVPEIDALNPDARRLEIAQKKKNLKWAEADIDFLLKISDDPDWLSLVSAWVDYELHSKTVKRMRLDDEKRPAVYNSWTRKRHKMPDAEELQDFHGRFVDWYLSLQPKERAITGQSFSTIFPVKSLKNTSYKTIHQIGSSGFVALMFGLAWLVKTGDRIPLSKHHPSATVPVLISEFSEMFEHLRSPIQKRGIEPTFAGVPDMEDVPEVDAPVVPKKRGAKAKEKSGPAKKAKTTATPSTKGAKKKGKA